jgi:hypothetical protein
MSDEYRTHRPDLSLTTDPSKSEQFLNSLEGERLAILPNVTVSPFLLTSRVDLLFIVEKVR